MTLKEIEAIEKLAKKATPGPWESECPIDDDNPWLVEAGKPSHEWRCLAMVTKSDDDIDVTEGSANLGLLLSLRNNADALCALAKEALELREALEWLDRNGNGLNKFGYGYDDSHWELLYNDGNKVEGSTPLEAINNARRGM